MVDSEQLTKDVVLHSGDCRDVLPTLAENSVDACVTDPPYELNFMGKSWDGTGVAFRPETWAAVYRVLKPGAHLLAMGGTRTYHRLACAIEDAGFEIRDCVSYLYGSGFPKSHNVSKGIDRAAGAERDSIGANPYNARRPNPAATDRVTDVGRRVCSSDLTAPATDAAREWEGWGTALKPAMELIVLARKPLSEGTVAANVLKLGTGAINVDGCRVAIDKAAERDNRVGTEYVLGEKDGINSKGHFGNASNEGLQLYKSNGRWPANLIHDGSEEVVAAFPDSKSCDSPSAARSEGTILGGSRTQGAIYPGENGSAARFFYGSKADGDDRLGSRHPTVKPVDLIQYLVRLVTPKGGTCLDPFAGTGTLGEACIREGMKAVLIEREEEYQEDIRRRMKLAMSGPDERAREAARAKNPTPDLGPLFTFANDYDAQADLAGSINEGFGAIRQRVANGGPGWEPK